MTKTEEIMSLHDAAATELVHGHYHPLLEKRAALKSAIEELVSDAGRYQWLRKTTNTVTSKGKSIDVKNDPQFWDAAIDAAMKEETP